MLTGQCCNKDKCQFETVGTVCRPAVNDQCDLAEYCDGKSEWCPDNTYILNGEFSLESYSSCWI